VDGREGEQLAGDDKPPPMCLERTCGIIGKHSLRGGATNDMYRITCRKVYFNVLPRYSFIVSLVSRPAFHPSPARQLWQSYHTPI